MAEPIANHEFVPAESTVSREVLCATCFLTDDGGNHGGEGRERLERGLAKLRRATEFALGYPSATVTRGEAAAILAALAASSARVASLEAVAQAVRETTHGAHHGSVWSPLYGQDVCAVRRNGRRESYVVAALIFEADVEPVAEEAGTPQKGGGQSVSP